RGRSGPSRPCRAVTVCLFDTLPSTQPFPAKAYEQPPQNTRRNEPPVKLIGGSLVMRHEYVAGAPVELMQIRQTASSADGVLHHPPEPFNGIRVGPTMGREKMEAKLVVVVLKGRVELGGAMDPAAIDDHHDLFAGGAESRHHLMDILAQL